MAVFDKQAIMTDVREAIDAAREAGKALGAANGHHTSISRSLDVESLNAEGRVKWALNDLEAALLSLVDVKR